jgi:nucleotidyltransferase substrate binding protein (TIGR01987 family)
VDRLEQRLLLASKAHTTLAEILTKPLTPEIRDASIQRFEYTYEALWKAAAHYLRDVHGLDAPSPKSVIRRSMEVRILSEEEAREAMTLVNDRNLTVHTYNEDLANEIYSRLPAHSALMQTWLRRLQASS